MGDRLANLLGAVALAASDRIEAGASSTMSHRGAHPAALVHLLAYPGESVEGVRRVLGISQPGAVRVTDRLEAASLVERRRGRDGRTLALHLTRKGRIVAGKVLAARATGVRELLDVLGADEQAALLGLLEKVVAGLAEDRAGALNVCRLCDRAACCDGGPCPLTHTTLAAAA